MVATEAQVFIEVAGKRVPATYTGSVFLQPPPPIETLDKRQRARISGYLQMVEENKAEPHPVSPLTGTTFENQPGLWAAANAYGVMRMDLRIAGAFVDAMLSELAGLSGHTMNTVAGVLHAWGKGKKPEDWRRMWEGT